MILHVEAGVERQKQNQHSNIERGRCESIYVHLEGQH